MSHKAVVITSDPFHSCVSGIEVESGKKDQIAIDDSGLDVDLSLIHI